MSSIKEKEDIAIEDISEEIHAFDELLSTMREADILKSVEESFQHNEHFNRLPRAKQKLLLNATAGLLKELDDM